MSYRNADDPEHDLLHGAPTSCPAAALLLLLFLFSDVGEKDGATRIRVGSHKTCRADACAGGRGRADAARSCEGRFRGYRRPPGNARAPGPPARSISATRSWSTPRSRIAARSRASWRSRRSCRRQPVGLDHRARGEAPVEQRDPAGARRRRTVAACWPCWLRSRRRGSPARKPSPPARRRCRCRGRTACRVHQQSRRPQLNLYVTDADGRAVQRLTSTAAEESRPVWSADGREPWCLGRPMAGQRCRRSPTRRAPSVSSRASTKAAGAAQAHIWVIDLATGARRELAAGAAHHDELPAWFPDGRRLAFSRGSLLLVEDCQTAVDEVGGSGHVVAVGRGEEHRQARDVVGLAEPAERNLAA